MEVVNLVTKKKWQEVQQRALDYFKKAKIVLTPAEESKIEIADFGLGRLEEFGLQLIIYVNTDRVCSKEMVLFPRQICPEHRHPAINNVPGKEETFRCRWGKVFLYVPGTAGSTPFGKPPADKKDCFTVWHEIILNPGEQYTLAPNTLHWFIAGDEGAIVSEFSTTSRDEYDIWTDPEIKRLPVVE
jgi:D-lyxose ketol-isomerase